MCQKTHVLIGMMQDTALACALERCAMAAEETAAVRVARGLETAPETRAPFLVESRRARKKWRACPQQKRESGSLSLRLRTLCVGKTKSVSLPRLDSRETGARRVERAAVVLGDARAG